MEKAASDTFTSYMNANMKYPIVKNFINGQFTDEQATAFMDVVSPVDGSLLSKVPLSKSAYLAKWLTPVTTTTSSINSGMLQIMHFVT